MSLIRDSDPLLGPEKYMLAHEYEKAEQSFADNLEAVRCVLLAPRQIPLKDFTTCCKKPKNQGGLYPLWGYPWTLPENCPNWNSCEDIFWAWLDPLKYSPSELQIRHEDQLLFRFLDQRDLRVRFAHLVSKHILPRDILKRAASSAHDERGLRLPSGSLSGAAQSAPTTSRRADVPSNEYEYQAPPERYSRPSSPPAGPTQGPEVDRLHQRVLVLAITLGLGTGGDAAAQAGNYGVLIRLAGRPDLLKREVSSMHLRAFRLIRRVEALLPCPGPHSAHSQPYAYGAYPTCSMYSAYGSGVRSYVAPPAYGLDRSLAVQPEAWVPAPAPSSTSVAGTRFEELGQGESASWQPPADHERRVRRH
ncbi:hypothetical protein PInf_007610 [Phytophthora infestans]|nr:hypothetical protein PInf_007610 [Phytophthora infestans]